MNGPKKMTEATADIVIGRFDDLPMVQVRPQPVPADHPDNLDNPLLIPGLIERFIDTHAAQGTVPARSAEDTMFAELDALCARVSETFDWIDAQADELAQKIATLGAR